MIISNYSSSFLDLFYLHIGSLVLLMIICESLWRQWKVKNGRLVPKGKKLNYVSAYTYEKQIRDGAVLCSLDDLILDVGGFMSRHPAGKFLIQNCIGRDMGKFFHGGYKMEDADNNVQIRPYRHSMAARKIIQELVIGRIETKAREAFCKVVKKVDIGIDTANFYFEAIDGHKHWSLFYKDVRHLGKFFLIHDVNHLEV